MGEIQQAWDSILVLICTVLVLGGNLMQYMRKESNMDVLLRANARTYHPLFTVVIPNYNKEPYIERAVTSIQKQSMSQWEIVFIDSGSTDGSREVITRLANKDPRIRTFFHKERWSTNQNRVFGVEQARGDWILSLDSDDELAPLTMEIDYNATVEHGADVVEHLCDQITPDGKREPWLSKYPRFKEANSKTVLKYFWRGKMNWNLARKMVSRELYMRCLDEMGLEVRTANISWAEDKMHCSLIFKNLKKMYVVDYVAYLYYRFLPSSSQYRHDIAEQWRQEGIVDGYIRNWFKRR